MTDGSVHRSPSLADKNPVNAISYEKEADFAAARFAYLVEKRDQLQDRMRFGILTLNGASLIALLSVVGKSETASWLGLTTENAKYSAAFFAVGVVLAAISALPQSNLLTREASDAYTRRLKASWLASFHRAEANETNWKTVTDLVLAYEKIPPVDFHYSRAAIALQNLAGGAWLAGILVPLLDLVL